MFNIFIFTTTIKTTVMEETPAIITATRANHDNNDNDVNNKDEIDNLLINQNHQ